MTKAKFFETVTVVAIAALGLIALVPAASAQNGKTFNLVYLLIFMPARY